jgi:hypothetical protein
MESKKRPPKKAVKIFEQFVLRGIIFAVLGKLNLTALHRGIFPEGRGQTVVTVKCQLRGGSVSKGQVLRDL